MIEVTRFSGEYTPAIIALLVASFGVDKPVNGFEDQIKRSVEVCAGTGERAGLYLGWKAGAPVGFYVLVDAIDPSNVFSNVLHFPGIAFFYCPDAADVREALLASIRKEVAAMGHSHFNALNATGNSDEAWAAFFATAGVATRTGSAMLFDVR